jgi:hypothetical protein
MAATAPKSAVSLVPDALLVWGYSIVMRFLLTPPEGSRPSLVVDTVAVIDASAIARLSEDMHGLGCPNGILFDDQRCVLLRDTFTSIDASSVVQDQELATQDVLGPDRAPKPSSLERRVARWLELLSVSWDRAVSSDPEVAAHLIQNIVPAAAGTSIHALATGDAAGEAEFA